MPRVTVVCSGCNGNGCHECGYTGKRRIWVPTEDECREMLRRAPAGNREER